MHFTSCPSTVPHYYPIVLHTIAGISIPINLLGLYLVVYQSPKIKGYKYCLCYLQASSFISELDMSIVSPGYYFFPMIAGYNLGIEIVHSHVCMSIYLFLFAFELPGLLVCFIFRNNAAEEIGRRTTPSKNYIKKFWLILCHIFPFVIGISFWNSRLTYEEKYVHLKTYWPECMEWLKNKYFEVYDYNVNPWLAVAGVGAVVTVIVVYFYFLWLSVDTILILQRYRTSMSAQTYKAHKTALFGLIMQLIIPGILIVIPLSVCMFVVVTGDVELQGIATNTQFMIASHSMCSCLVMILCNPNYRNFLGEKFMKMLRKVSSRFEKDSRGNSVVVVTSITG